MFGWKAEVFSATRRLYQIQNWQQQHLSWESSASQYYQENSSLAALLVQLNLLKIKYLLIIYFSTSEDTLMGNMGNENELFALPKCIDVPLAAVLEKLGPVNLKERTQNQLFCTYEYISLLTSWGKTTRHIIFSEPATRMSCSRITPCLKNYLDARYVPIRRCQLLMLACQPGSATPT